MIGLTFIVDPEIVQLSWETVLTSVISSGVFSALCAWWFQRELEGFKNELARNRAIGSHVWQMKRDACLRAMNVANAVLSNYEYENVSKGNIIPQFENIENIRACLNELACTCETSAVLKQLKRILFESVSPDAIVDLRNAVRGELALSTDAVDKDRERAFVARVNCDPRITQRHWQTCTSWQHDTVTQDSTAANDLSTAHINEGLAASIEDRLPQTLLQTENSWS